MELERRIRKLEARLLVEPITLTMLNGEQHQIPGCKLLKLFTEACRAAWHVRRGEAFQSPHAAELALIQRSVSDDSQGGLIDFIRMLGGTK